MEWRPASWRNRVARLEHHAQAWCVEVEQVLETDSSVLAFGRRRGQPVVLKVIRHPGDEWASGDVLDRFQGTGVVRVLENVGGAVLLERLTPGDSLLNLSLGGEDAEATAVLAVLIRKMAPRSPPPQCPGVRDWAQGFDRHAAGGQESIPRPLLDTAHRVYLKLCDSQSQPRLLHGDLHHYNVLHDLDRGWIAIDPKGVIGEIEYEVGAALRNPYERPDLFADPATVERRVAHFSRELRVDARRILGWAFAQAVLAAIWEVESNHRLDGGHGWLALADTIQPMFDKGSGL